MNKEDSDPVKDLATFLIRRRSEELHSITLSPDAKLHYPLYIEYLTPLNSISFYLFVYFFSLNLFKISNFFEFLILNF